MLLRYLTFLKIVNEEFSDMVVNIELHPDRIRLILTDKSWVDIRYPVEDKFSFHWQRSEKIYRIDTAPHHRNIKTYPRHIHLGSENNIVEDNVTEGGKSPEDNFRRFMLWVRNTLQND
ncbi:toxin-antitoxin system TumE family protein [Geoglobus acetivorans]|uniref:toxin-antitoxin system TumE family protein n=1 Tax=Geoglobus acetivorans TaxID=565033 RepID=UPI00069327C9